jgi:invasion protein IalB
MRILSVLTGLAFAALISNSALAQAPAAPAQPAAPAAPGTPEVKSVGDWLVRCYPAQNQSPCDMYQQLNDTNSHQRVLAVSIAYIPKLDRHALQISVPLGVAIGAGAIIHTGGYASPALPYRRCDRVGCYVEMLIDNGVVDQLSHGGDSGMVRITADDGKTYEVKLSLNGFSAAHDSMAEQARARVAREPAAGTAAPAAAAAAAKRK